MLVHFKMYFKSHYFGLIAFVLSLTFLQISSSPLHGKYNCVLIRKSIKMLLKEYWTLFPTSKSNQNQLNKKTAILIMLDPAMKIQNVVMLLMEVIVQISFVDQQKVSFQIIFEKHRYSILDSSQCIPDGDGLCFDNSECCSGTCSHFFVCKPQKINKRVVLIAKQAKRLKSCKRRLEVDWLDGQLAQWSIGLMVDRLNGR